MFPSQRTPEVLLDSNKDIIFITELHKLYKIGRELTRSSLVSKTQTLYFWNKYSKLALKNYMAVLQHGLPYSVNFMEKIEKFTNIIQRNCFWMSSDFMVWYKFYVMGNIQ